MIERLTPEDIRDIHDVMITRYGGLDGEYEPGLIDFMADKPFGWFEDTELYPGLFMKAAVYMEGFATKQLFCDANKRTAYMCGKIFLELNGFMVDVADEDLYNTAIAVANQEMELRALARWFELNSYRL